MSRSDERRAAKLAKRDARRDRRTKIRQLQVLRDREMGTLAEKHARERTATWDRWQKKIAEARSG